MSRLSIRHLRALARLGWYMSVVGPLHVLRDVQPCCHNSARVHSLSFPCMLVL